MAPPRPDNPTSMSWQIVARLASSMILSPQVRSSKHFYGDMDLLTRVEAAISRPSEWPISGLRLVD